MQTLEGSIPLVWSFPDSAAKSKTGGCSLAKHADGPKDERRTDPKGQDSWPTAENCFRDNASSREKRCAEKPNAKAQRRHPSGAQAGSRVREASSLRDTGAAFAGAHG